MIELPSAIPTRNVTSMIENAYVELPMIAVSARVHDTSYIIETKPDTASVISTSLSASGLDGGNSGIAVTGSASRADDSIPPDIHIATRPIATLIAATISVVRRFPILGISTSAARSDPAAAPNV